MTGPYLYTVEMEGDPAFIQKIIDWNAWRHAPDMYKAGFQTAAAYLGRGGPPDYMNIYELGAHECFLSPSFTSISTRDTYSLALMPLRRNVRQTLYLQETLGHADDRTLQSPFDADHVTLVWFDAAADIGPALMRWVQDEAWPQLSSLGVQSLRRASRTTNRPGAESDRPAQLLLCEWDRPPTAHDLSARLAAEFGDQISAVDQFAGDRIYPWPNQPKLGRTT